MGTYLNFELHKGKSDILDIVQTLEQIKPHLGNVNEIIAINDAIEILLQIYENGDKYTRNKDCIPGIFIEYDY